MGTELNQALVQQALSFAPEITEERQAVKVWEDGTVEFYLYAPTAETVEVAGVGGYFDAAPLALLPDPYLHLFILLASYYIKAIQFFFFIINIFVHFLFY